MRDDDPMRQSGARWCDEHQQWECTKARSKGRGVCHGVAIRGMDVCRMHAGKPASVVKAQGEALSAWRAVVGGEQLVDPASAVLGMLQMSWLRASLLSEMLERQVAADGIAMPTEGLVGHTMALHQATGNTVAIGEATRGLAVLEAQERDRVVRFAKTAHDMGIAEAQIGLARRQADLWAASLGWLIEQLTSSLQLGAVQVAAIRGLVNTMVQAMAAGQAPAALPQGGA